MTVVCFTSLGFGTLPRARVLAETLLAAHPDWPLWAVLVDRAPDNYANRAAFAGFARVLEFSEIGIPDVLRWLFRHDRGEARAAVKGAMLRHLLALGAEAVVYFDPDIAVFHPLATLPERLQAASILLAPHQTEPEAPARPCHGAYNPGFLAVRNDSTGRAFADWLAARSPTDEKDFDAVPALFDRVGIVRDPGWNVGGCNLPQRRLRFDAEGGISANGSPLAFYQFAGNDKVGAAPEPHELCRWYARRLAALAEPGIPPGWWHFSTFSDGTPIPRAARLLARARPDVLARFENPFAVEGESFFRWLQAETPEAFSSGVPPTTAAR